VFHVDGVPDRRFREVLAVGLRGCRYRRIRLPEVRTNRPPLPEVQSGNRYQVSVSTLSGGRCIRLVLRAGIISHEAKKISGHKTGSMFRRYHITSEDDVREAMERTPQLIAAKSKAERLAANSNVGSTLVTGRDCSEEDHALPG
jgi:hypothetical protein